MLLLLLLEEATCGACAWVCEADEEGSGSGSDGDDVAPAPDDAFMSCIFPLPPPLNWGRFAWDASPG